MDPIIEVSEANFVQDVVERSKQVPVLVDFWAAWCGPCRALGPILEKLAREMDGAFVLAKVDTERSPALAQHFGVRGIPDVKLIVDGQIRAGFTGAQPEANVRAFLKEHLPSPTDDALAQARTALASGDTAQARSIASQVLEAEPTHAPAQLLLARCALADGDEPGVREHVQNLPPGSPEAEQGQVLLKLFELARAGLEKGSAQQVAQALEQASDDGALQFAHGAHQAAAGHYENALEAMVQAIVRPGEQRRAAHQAMLTLFGVLGSDHPLTREYRGRLQVVL